MLSHKMLVYTIMALKKTLFAILCIVFCQISFAQSKDEKKVAVAVDSLTAAFISGSISSLEKWTDNKLSYGHSSGVVQDKAAFLDNFRTGKTDFVSMNLTDQQITIFGKTAIVRHMLTATNNDNGTPGTNKLLILLVWQKSGKDWKLIARQAVKPAA